MYTKKQRRVRYEKMLDFIGSIMKPNKVYDGGLCFALYKVTKRDCVKLWKYPELMKHEPKKPHSAFWFPINKSGTDKRIRILIEAVMDTYDR